MYSSKSLLILCAPHHHSVFFSFYSVRKLPLSSNIKSKFVHLFCYLYNIFYNLLSRVFCLLKGFLLYYFSFQIPVSSPQNIYNQLIKMPGTLVFPSYECVNSNRSITVTANYNVTGTIASSLSSSGTVASPSGSSKTAPDTIKKAQYSIGSKEIAVLGKFAIA